MTVRTHFVQRIFSVLLPVLVALAAVWPAPTPAQAAGGPPLNIFDPDSTGWASVRNMTGAQFSAHFAQMEDDGYMLVDIEVDEIGGNERVGAVWQYNTDGRGWAEWRNLTSAQFSDKWNYYKDNGYRLIDQESYILDGNRYYAGVWTENKEGLAWASWRNLTSAQFSDKFQQMKDAGYMPVDVEAYPFGSGLRYAVIWVKNTDNLSWVEWRDLSSDEYHDKFEQYKDTHRVVDVESYRHNGQQYYAGIWLENTDNRHWAAWRDMSAKTFGDKWQQYRDAGYRLTDYEAYPTGSGWKYAGVWRQNGFRPDWSLKNQVDDYLENQMSTHNLPGMSVAIAKNGQIVYLRGFGYADVDDQTIATSRTCYRLASVSKAMAGIAAMRLVDQGVLNLNQDTRFYVPGLPAHHTHKVWQTIANRSGIGHYDDHGSSNGEFDTALAGAQFFVDDPLVYAPGAGYKYSTHAYTVLGAAMEGATGDPVAQIVQDMLSDPFDLPSLRAEDLHQNRSCRASLYNGSNDEVTPDPIEWKVWGGGLEGSAYDLVRLGIHLVAGDVMPDALRTQMWTPPDGFSNYALGWNTGDDDGHFVVAKNGAQQGARSYIRIYPDDQIAIVVLTNRDGGDHSPTQMGRDLGTMLLNAPAIPAIGQLPGELAPKPAPVQRAPGQETPAIRKLILAEPAREQIELIILPEDEAGREAGADSAPVGIVPPASEDEQPSLENEEAVAEPGAQPGGKEESIPQESTPEQSDPQGSSEETPAQAQEQMLFLPQVQR